MSPNKPLLLDFGPSTDLQSSLCRLRQIVCPIHWSAGFDVEENFAHRSFVDMVRKGVISVYECEYDISGLRADRKTQDIIQILLDMPNPHSVLSDMAVLFEGLPLERAQFPDHALYLPEHKSVVTADGMNPEDMAPLLASDNCEAVIFFPNFPLDNKRAYYGLELCVTKEQFRMLLVGRLNEIESEENNRRP
jgi:hypothetical protein